jgi:PAS domain S-box-containing protein
LLQFNDRRPDRFTPAKIALMERAAGSLAIALEQRRTQAELRRSDERYRLIAENTTDVIWLLDLQSRRFTYVSPAVTRLLGYSPEEFATVSLPEFLTPEGFAYCARLLAEGPAALEAGDESMLRLVHRLDMVRKDGTVVPTEITTSVLPNERVRAAQVLGVTRDISERLQAEARLMQAQKMESVGRLAGGVAHDFNNLLTVINGYSRLVLGQLTAGDPLRERVDEILAAGERAAGLTQQLLAFSRKQVLKPRLLDLNRVLHKMQPMLGRLLGEDVALRVELAAESATICADPHQLEQVVMNLAVNSRDAMPKGGELSIRTGDVEWGKSDAWPRPGARAGSYVLLAVSDTGQGMSEETRRHIFEPFFTTKEVGKGTGLGLSMVLGIVEQSGGYIEVESVPGQGATFRIYLPRVAGEPEDSGKPEAGPAMGGKETVLVVEDQAEVRKYAAAALRVHGYRVIQAGSAEEALEICEREHGRIGLLLTDVVMPNLSGKELERQVAERWPAIKVLFMSGYSEDAIVQHGGMETGTKLIQKPFSPGELAHKVVEMLAGKVRAARILVADDEAGVRKFFRLALEQAGYEVTEAENGKQALEQALAGRIDLFITDLAMPEKEGIETIRALRREAPGIGIVAVSGAFGGTSLSHARMLGADVVLSKPVDAELLLAKVAEVLGARRS